MFKRPIAISLSPNTQKQDVLGALKTLFKPWQWKWGKNTNKVEAWFKDYFQVKDAVSFNSGRSALYALFKTLNIGFGDEVIIQAFTCVAVCDPILWVGAKPVYVDIDESLNIDDSLLEKSISPKTKAIVVQHTFGIPAKIEKIKKIVQKHNLILIEDCAHSLGTKINGRKIGSFGDASFFSFGRDKVISSVFGGMAIINQKSRPEADQPMAGKVKKLREFQEKLEYPSYFWILQQLLHPIAFALILPLYDIWIGKLILFILLKFKLLSKPVYPIEYCGGRPTVIPRRYPNALASLLLLQLNKLESFNTKRKEIASIYFQKLKSLKNILLPPKISGSVYLRFNIILSDSYKILKKAKRQNLLLGNWYKSIIDPRNVSYKDVGYKLKSCPKAEKAAHMSVNLPTYPTISKKDINKIVEFLKAYEN